MIKPSQTIIKLPVAELRDYQKGVYDFFVNNNGKRGVLVWSRRSGKDIVCLNIIAAMAIKEKGTYFYCNPTYTQCVKTIWKSISNDGTSMLDMAFPRALIAKKNDADMSVTLINGSIVTFLGSDNIDRIVGTNPKMIVYSEAALSDPRGWNLLRPVLANNKGAALFVSTPRGRNWFYDLYNLSKSNKDWYSSLLTCEQTGSATKEEVQKEIEEGMDPRLAQQEFYCSFDVGSVGSYYADEIAKMREDGRISDFPIDTAYPVYTACDLGYSDATSFIFYQHIGEWFYIIDEYESNGQSLKDYVKMLREKGYNYDRHYFPHDINQHELGTGYTRLQMLREIGINGDVVPLKSLNYGIECVHRLFPRVKIHSKCKSLIKSLEMYRKKFDERNNVFLDTPVHDAYSHYCFVGDTVVKTIDGDKKIKDIKIGDKVYIGEGLYGEVEYSMCTGVKDVVKLTFNDGRVIECTPDHEFITTKGLTRADSISYTDPVLIEEGSELWELFCKSKPKKARDEFISNIKVLSIGCGEKEVSLCHKKVESKRSCTMKSFGTVLKDIIQGQKILITLTCQKITGIIQKVRVIENLTTDHIKDSTTRLSIKEKTTSIISQKLTDSCTDTCGNSTMVIYQKGLLSTIKTMIEVIMISLIWSLCLPLSILRCIVNKVNGSVVKKISNSLQVCVKKLLNGIKAKKEESGIECMQRSAILATKSMEKEFVNGVEKSLSQRLLNKNSVVPTTKITLICVEREKEKRPVYNITVKDHHCFFANGILVSNCDAFRYFAEVVRDQLNVERSNTMFNTKREPYNPMKWN